MTRTVTEQAAWNAAWVERNTGLTLTEDQSRCVNVLCSIARPYNLPLIGGGWHDVAESDDGGVDYEEAAPVRPPVVIHPLFVMARLHRELSTTDFDDLTRLVLAAHVHAVRVSVRAEMHLAVDTESYLSRWDNKRSKWVETTEHPSYALPCLNVILHPRQRDGHIYERHPTIEQAIAAMRTTGTTP